MIIVESSSMQKIYCVLKIMISLLIGVSSMKGQSITKDFFIVHDSTTTYMQNGQRYSAAVTCRSDNCTLTVHYPDGKTKTYKIMKRSLRITKCPPALCTIDNGKFTTNPKDHCPVCDYGSYYTREPCQSSDDCPTKSGCSRTGSCHYSKKPGAAAQYAPFCQFRADCPAFHKCSKRTCQPTVKKAFHVEGLFCYSDLDCPNSNFRCVPSLHACLANKNYCQNDEMCRTGFVCDSGSKCKKVDLKTPKKTDRIKFVGKRKQATYS